MRIHLELIGLRGSLAVRVLVNGLNAKTGLLAGSQAPSDTQDYTALHCECTEAFLVSNISHYYSVSYSTAARVFIGSIYECQQRCMS